jgi:hypothetical protein
MQTIEPNGTDNESDAYVTVQRLSTLPAPQLAGRCVPALRLPQFHSIAFRIV